MRVPIKKAQRKRIPASAQRDLARQNAVIEAGAEEHARYDQAPSQLRADALCHRKMAQLGHRIRRCALPGLADDRSLERD